MKQFLFVLLALVPSFLFSQKNTDSRLFELRIYDTAPGKLEALETRFRRHTMKLFKKHGMENIGYLKPIHNDKNQLVYVLAYPDMPAREAAWKAFGEDPKWKKVQKKSERNGQIVTKVESIFLETTDFSPALTLSTPGNRVFELRTYYLAPGRLDAIQARFRDHTMKLFENHGMTNVVYWTTVEKDGSQAKLVYLLAHPSEAAGKKAFEDFVKDPEWIRVKTASELSGKIVEKVESVYLTAEDFSPIR